MGPSDLGNAPLAALLSSFVFLLLLYRWPAGAIFYGATVNGIGGLVQFGPIKYNYIVTVLQMLGVGWLAWQGARAKPIPTSLRPFQGPLRWLLLGIAVLWFRIAVDVLIFRLDQFQSVSLKLGLCQAVLPTFLLFFAVRRLTLDDFRVHLAWGMLLQGAAYVLPAFPAVIGRGALSLARLGEERLTLYAQDTISGAYYMFLMLCGLILMLQSRELRAHTKILIGAGLVFVVAVLFLNGTRQYLAAGMVLVMLIWMGSLRQKALFVLGVGGIVAVIGMSFVQSMADTEAGWRLTSGGVREEMYNSRGKIWADAFASGKENFLQGVGFRQFGEVLVRHEATGEYYDYRDEAHGVFQNIIAEQGYMLGLALFGLFGVAIAVVIRNGWMRRGDEAYRAIFSVAIALMVPLFFSGTAVNTVGFYVFFILAAAYSARKVEMVRRMGPRPAWPR